MRAVVLNNTLRRIRIRMSNLTNMMRIRILTLMRIRILIFTSMRICILIQLLMKGIQISANNGLQALYGSMVNFQAFIVSLNGFRVSRHGSIFGFHSSLILIFDLAFDFDADPDPAFHSDMRIRIRLPKIMLNRIPVRNTAYNKITIFSQ